MRAAPELINHELKRLDPDLIAATVFNAQARSRVPPRIFDSLFQPVVTPKDLVV
jgi:hypothetical protein